MPTGEHLGGSLRDEIREIVKDVVHSEVEPLRLSVKDLVIVIQGPRGEPAKGVIVRLDRQEQIEKRRSFWIGTSLVIAFTALIEAVVSWVTGKRT